MTTWDSGCSTNRIENSRKFHAGLNHMALEYWIKKLSMENATVLFFFCSFEGVFSLFLMYLSNEDKNWAFENDKDWHCTLLWSSNIISFYLVLKNDILCRCTYLQEIIFFSRVLRPDLFQITSVFFTVCCRIPCQSCTIVEEVSGITWALSLFLSVHVPICLVDKGIAKIQDQNPLIFCWCIYLRGTALRTF